MRKYSIKKQFYVNQKEDDLLKIKSEKAGLSEAEFLRSCIKGYKIKEQPSNEIRKFINQITGIANNINQIARVTNATRNINNEEVMTIKNTINFSIRFLAKLEKVVSDLYKFFIVYVTINTNEIKRKKCKGGFIIW